MNPKTISFWSASGGTGTTTLATAFALTLRRHKTEVVLADFKEVTPHVHKYFGIDLREKSNIYEAIEKGQDVVEAIRQHLKKRQGIWIFPGVGLEDFTKFEEKHFSIIIEVLKKEFDHVVIDTSPGIFFSSTYASLKNSDLIYAVLVPTRWGLGDTALMINFISDRWNVEKSRFKALLNMADSGEIDVHTVEKVLEVEGFSVRQGQKHINHDVDKLARVLLEKKTVTEYPIKASKEVRSFGIN